MNREASGTHGDQPLLITFTKPDRIPHTFHPGTKISRDRFSFFEGSRNYLFVLRKSTLWKKLKRDLLGNLASFREWKISWSRLSFEVCETALPGKYATLNESVWPSQIMPDRVRLRTDMKFGVDRGQVLAHSVLGNRMLCRNLLARQTVRQIGQHFQFPLRKHAQRDCWCLEELKYFSRYAWAHYGPAGGNFCDRGRKFPARNLTFNQITTRTTFDCVKHQIRVLASRQHQDVATQGRRQPSHPSQTLDSIHAGEFDIH